MNSKQTRNPNAESITVTACSARFQGSKEAGLTESRLRSNARGFTTIEMLLVLTITSILAAVAIPLTRSSLRAYNFGATVSGLTGAIQSTRYQAIMKGYPFALTISQAVGTYQISSKPTGALVFSNVGAPFTLEPGAVITFNTPTTTIQFNPNGTVQATVGGLGFSMSDGYSTKDIIVSGVGNVTVVP
jgi:prepilin-type N-terminal cleavage/methylation domain-containing protein